MLLSRLIVGVALRLRGLNLSLWQDEAWVANSVIEPGLRGMLYYEAWLQTTPPLFLMLVRAIVEALGMANWVFKLIPFLAGCTALAGMLYLLRRMFPDRRLVAGYVGLMAAVSPTAVYYSHVLKQYSCELFASTVLLLALLAYAAEPSVKRFALLALAVTAGLTLAYGLAVFLPAALVVSSPWFLRRWRGGEGGSVGRWLMLALGAAVTVAAEYWLLVVPNSNPLLDGFWRTPIEGGPVVWATHAYSSVFVLLWHLPLPAPAIQFTGARIFAVVSVLVILPAIVWRTRRSGWRRGPAEFLLLVSLATVLAAIALGLLRIYPLVIRTSLLYLPCVLALAGCGLALIEEEYFSRLRKGLKKPLRIGFWVLLFGVLVAGVHSRRSPLVAEDVQGAVAHLRDNAAPADRIYVHASAVEGFKLYTRMFGWTPEGAVLGEVGFPCCPRIEGPIPAASEERLQEDMGRALPSRRLWVLHSDHQGIEWTSPGANYPQLTGEILREAGCREEEPASYHNMAVRLFVCEPAAAAK